MKKQKKSNWWNSLCGGASVVVGVIVCGWGIGWIMGGGLALIYCMLHPTGRQYTVSEFLHVMLCISILVVMLEKLFVYLGRVIDEV